MPRECIICGARTRDQRRQTTYDYCRRCYEESIQVLEERYEQKEASRNPGKESREATTK